MVQDGGDPRLYDTAVINVFVERNLQPPQFLPNNNRVVVYIPENSPRGRFIYKLEANDTDLYVCLFFYSNHLPNMYYLIT